MINFNYDSITQVPFVVTVIIIGGLITYSCFSTYNIYTTQNLNESLVNTSSSLDSIGPQATELPVLESSKLLVEASVQTVNTNVEASVQAANTYVNTGMQTSAKMWLESIKNWITEILSSPTQAGKYVDVGVQVDTSKSTWQTVKQWFLEVCSVRSSDLSSMGYNKVANWRNNIDSIQSVDLHDSESPLTTMAFGSPYNSTLDKLVDPDESASQVSEIISESILQVPSNSVYDINMYNQEFLYESLNNVSNHIDHSYVINGVTHTVLVIADKILTIDPNIVVNPFIC